MQTFLKLYGGQIQVQLCRLISLSANEEPVFIH